MGFITLVRFGRPTTGGVPNSSIASKNLRRFYRPPSASERELVRLANIPRYTPTTTNLLGETIHIIDARSFLSMKHAYNFEATGPDPLILDCGANIGLATLYWKRTYPAARIVAFEPDPKLFSVLEQNTKQLLSVTLLRNAVWQQECELPFQSEGSWAGRVCVPGDKESFMVSALRLRDFLDDEVDFLKLDVEGAECQVLADCGDRLWNVRNLFAEYHSIWGCPQTLPELLTILKETGFRYYIRGHHKSQPLISRSPGSYNSMDLQLDIFAYRT